MLQFVKIFLMLIPPSLSAVAAIDVNLLNETVGKGETFPVWPAGRVPNRTGEVKWRCKNTDGSVRLTDVNEPELSFFKAEGKGLRPAVIVCPGGAYAHLSYLHEGVEVAEWLAHLGVSAFVLKYRCPNQRESACRDIQRAISLIRAGAGCYGIDPKRIGVMGFSAGAHLAAWASVNHAHRSYAPVDEADVLSCRPDFSIIVYPGLMIDEARGCDGGLPRLANGLAADDTTPPAFLIQAEDDFVHVENSLAYYLSLKAAGVRAEMHLYPDGGHGYGIRHVDASVSGWERALENWLKRFVLVNEMNRTGGVQGQSKSII